jgi:hypothetical protein
MRQMGKRIFSTFAACLFVLLAVAAGIMCAPVQAFAEEDADSESEPTESFPIRVYLYGADCTQLSLTSTFGGATVAVKDAEGNVVDEWLTGRSFDSDSNMEYHECMLKPGTYCAEELSGPDDHTLSPSVTFTVKENGLIDGSYEDGSYIATVGRDSYTSAFATRVMLYSPIKSYTFKFSKQNVYGQPVRAIVALLVNGTRRGVTIWSSSDEPVSVVDVIPGSYTIKEFLAFDGYQLADDISVQVDEDGTIWADGKLIGENDVVTMIDHRNVWLPLTFEKLDQNGEPVIGATLELKGDGGIVDTWTTDGTVHTVNADAGTYTLVETDTPEGYETADPISIEIGEDKFVTVDGKTTSGAASIVMVDNKIEVPETPTSGPVKVLKARHEFSFLKRDADGKPLSGAAIELRAADGSVIDSWTTDGTVRTFKVDAGVYTLVETAAPEGYLKAGDITVTVADDGTVSVAGADVVDDTVVMVDEAVPDADVPVVSEVADPDPDPDPEPELDEKTEEPATDPDPEKGEELATEPEPAVETDLVAKPAETDSEPVSDAKEPDEQKTVNDPKPAAASTDTEAVPKTADGFWSGPLAACVGVAGVAMVAAAFTLKRTVAR